MSTSVKHLRDNSARMHKLQKLGAQGSLKQARKGEFAPRKYAAGGAVGGDEIGGMPAKPNLARPGRSKGKGTPGKKGGATVNVIVMSGKGAPDAGPKPMAGPPPDMPMPPPGPPPGGPPMPMRKFGGSVGKFAKGGRVKKEMGGSVKKGDEKHEYSFESNKIGPQTGTGGVPSLKDIKEDSARQRKMDPPDGPNKESKGWFGDGGKGESGKKSGGAVKKRGGKC